MSSTQTSLIEIGMPRLSDSMEEATVLRWLKQPGDRVSRGEPLVEVETDKATIVYEAEAGGVLEEIVVDDGGTAALGAVIARLRPDDEQAPPSTAAAQERPAPAERSAKPARRAARAARAARAGRARATPIARRLATQLSVVLDGLDGTGPGGRIVAADVRAAATAEGGRDDVTEILHTPTQRTIAERMTESRATVPEFTLEAEIDMDGAAALREELKRSGREPVPSYNDLVVRAAALALRDFPALNSSYAPGTTRRHGQINIGIAVDTEDALLVPTIRAADRKSVFEIAEESRRLAERSRARALRPDELAGATFTVSNLGMFGVRRFHAVINPPQAAILAVGDVAPRPVVDSKGAVIARKTMDVTVACDHRVVYGAEAARFLQRLRHLLEHPLALVID